MEAHLAIHNTHRSGLEAFLATDPQLRALHRQALVFEPPLLRELPTRDAGIYTLGGARQIGKTTLLKQWMVKLLRSGIESQRIAFLTGELVDDHHRLVRTLQGLLAEMPEEGPLFLMIDEITYIRGWDRAVKFCADAGMLERVVLVVTGSDLSFVREARAMLPGRRGTADRVDYHLYPLDYPASCELEGLLARQELEVLAAGGVDEVGELKDDTWTRSYAAIDDYLVHGGFLTAINDMARHHRILPATLAIYSDWIRGDVLKNGKQEGYLREVLASILRRLGSQVTWNALARDLSIDHPSTVASYVELLAAMDALFVQPALAQDRLGAAPKKARKVMPCDPFILHAIQSWLQPVEDPYEAQILPFCQDPASAGTLMEAVVVNHARRKFSTFYIKAEGEVDLAIIDAGTFWPIEVKWRSQTRPKDLKQIRKYRNGVVAARVRHFHDFEGTPLIPLPVVLCRLSAGKRP